MIKIYDRNEKRLIDEHVVGGNLLKLLYEKTYGKPFLFFVKRKFFSSFYGRLMDTKWSRRFISGFIRDHDLAMDESEQAAEEFKTFNEFFTRKLKPEARPFDSSPEKLISPCDSRLLAFENIDTDKVIQVKGMTYALKDLLLDESLSEKYQGGTVMVFRLNPLDYHRFHFPDDGVAHGTHYIDGFYYSVNPLALQTIPRLYVENKRTVTKFESAHFGTFLYLEIGATNVGSIIQTYSETIPVKRGSEKGYFKFGGSTVILFAEKDKIKVDEDILLHSSRGVETRVLFGESIGSSEVYKQFS